MHFSNIKRKIAVLTIAVACILCGAAQAATGNSKAKQIVDSLYCGGGLAPINDLIVEMDCTDLDEKSQQLQPSSKDKIYFKAPNKLRVDSIIQDPGGPLDQRQSIIIRDGVTMWHYLSTGQYPVKKKPDVPSPTANLPFNIQRYPIDETKSYEFGQQRLIEGVQTQEIVVKNPQDPKDERHVFVDVARAVPMLMEYTRYNGDKGVRVTVEYGSIAKLSDGRFFPFLIKIYHDGKLDRVRAYKGVVVNAGLDDSFFSHMGSMMQKSAK